MNNITIAYVLRKKRLTSVTSANNIFTSYLRLKT